MVTRFDFNNRSIGEGAPVFIIAEAGVNHNGDLDQAKRLIDEATAAGADAVKFQSYQAEKVLNPEAVEKIVSRASSGGESPMDALRRLELSLDDLCILKSHCVEMGILFMATPFDNKSVDELDGMGIPLFKLSSGEVTNLPLLRHVSKKGKPIILSTGMSYLGEVDQAVGAMRREGCHKLALLHCVSNFPAEPQDVNLQAMKTMADALRLPVGFSDHTIGFEIAVAAVALGAFIIEKHITLDRNQIGPDHHASLEPAMFKDMVQKIRSVERAMGDGIKKPVLSEMATRDLARRSLAVSHNMVKGDKIGHKDLVCLRPANGLSPVYENQILGKNLRNNLKEGEFISWGDFE